MAKKTHNPYFLGNWLYKRHLELIIFQMTPFKSICHKMSTSQPKRKAKKALKWLKCLNKPNLHTFQTF